jgi:hypothetical protein
VSHVTGLRDLGVDPLSGREEGEVTLQRTSLRAALVGLAALCLLASGCDIRSFRIQVPGFDAQQIEGIWLWRQAPNGEFQRDAEIRFTERATIGALEYQVFDFVSAQGGFTLQSLIKRPAGAPGDATLELALSGPPGTFKVSSYNAAGESPLSAGQMTR